MTNKAEKNSATESKLLTDFVQGYATKVCDLTAKKSNKLLKEECSEKEFVIDSDCPCPAVGEAAKVDLVVVIDTSGSMSDESVALSSAADDAIQAARDSCPSDLEVVWLGIEGTFEGTLFNQTVREYLKNNGVNANAGGAVQDDDLEGRISVPSPAVQGAREDGARTIVDITDHYNWRPGSARLIFYLGDEGLEGGNPQELSDETAADMAISAAQNAPNVIPVTVHTYAGTGVQTDSANEYERVALETGGSFFSAAENDFDNFKGVLQEVICSGTKVCKPAKVPELMPCLKINWGDGPKDQIETTDTECLCITACNRYSNITFKDVTIVISVITKSDGSPVPELPDGTPSVFIKPSKFISFGDLPPCDCDHPDELSCISRELVLVSCGAQADEYCLKIGLCYSLHFDLNNVCEFKLPICES